MKKSLIHIHVTSKMNGVIENDYIIILLHSSNRYLGFGFHDFLEERKLQCILENEEKGKIFIREKIY